MIEEIQRRLKPESGPAPKVWLLAFAVAWARQPSLKPKDLPGLPAGGSRTRIIGFRDRIIDDGLLTACATKALPSFFSGPGASELIVEESRVRSIAPGIIHLEVGVLMYGSNRSATRTLSARLEFADGAERVCCMYEFAPAAGEGSSAATLRTKRHRSREEARTRPHPPPSCPAPRAAAPTRLPPRTIPRPAAPIQRPPAPRPAVPSPPCQLNPPLNAARCPPPARRIASVVSRALQQQSSGPKRQRSGKLCGCRRLRFSAFSTASFLGLRGELSVSSQPRCGLGPALTSCGSAPEAANEAMPSVLVRSSERSSCRRGAQLSRNFNGDGSRSRR